jgi:hypothetical protein
MTENGVIPLTSRRFVREEQLLAKPKTKVVE